jgi:tetratricopeptide (TPR) repeat protein
MSRTLKLGLALVALVGMQQATARANGSSMSAPAAGASSSMQEQTPEDQARNSYNSGIDHRDKARKLEDQAATQQGKDQDKTLDKAKDEFTKALKDFQKAASLSPDMYQAYNGMGYAYRKTGDYTSALENYDKALKMAPGFADAQEYRGEAYLGLNRIDDAKQSYMTLFATDRKQADALLKAMATWVTQHTATPGTVDPAAVTALDTWVKDRAQIAGTTVAMAVTDSRSIWN